MWRMVFQQISISGHMQDGFPAKHPRETTIQLDSDNPQPYPVGRYTVSPESFYFGEFDRFTLGRIKLQPLNVFFKDCERQLGVTVGYNQSKAA
jgi:Helix-destabilising protein